MKATMTEDALRQVVTVLHHQLDDSLKALRKETDVGNYLRAESALRSASEITSTLEAVVRIVGGVINSEIAGENVR